MRLETRALIRRMWVRFFASTQEGQAWMSMEMIRPALEFDYGDLYLLPGGSVSGRIVDAAGYPACFGQVVVGTPRIDEVGESGMPGSLDPFWLRIRSETDGSFDFR
ncbi:MAG: hypothetical protein ACI841_002640 [Planctomycetota bacterium]